MKLHSNWKNILRKAWSVKFLALAGVLQGVEVALPLFADAIPRGAFALLSFLSVAGAFVARIVAQKDVE